ncbi:MAG: TraB/GumN family protein [Bacteroidota bacterium]
MHRILALALAVSAALALPTSSAQEATELASPQETDERNPLLFVMEDDDSRVYLLGSIHLLDAESYPLPADVEAAYQDADALAFEVDMRDLASVQAAVMSRAQYTNGGTLQEAIGAEAFATLDSLMTPFGMPAIALNSFEPWAVQLTLAGLGAQALGYNPQNGVDMHFTTRAQSDEKPIFALETAESQMDIFDGTPEEAQVAQLTEMLAEWEEQAAVFEALVSAWESGDEMQIVALMNDLPEESHNALLRDRNAVWVPQIEAMLAGTDDVLVVVGAGHLAGDVSVVAMLREKGYTLTRQ